MLWYEKFTKNSPFSPQSFRVNRKNITQQFRSHCSLYTESHTERERVNELSAVIGWTWIDTGQLYWVKKAMASVIGLPVRWSRLKIINFKQFSRTFNTNQQIYRKLNSEHKYWWYLLGGSVCAVAYLKWQHSVAVAAFNPKKIKVSVSVVYF